MGGKKGRLKFLSPPARVPGRSALAQELAEQRFADTVEEMATAAMIPVPQVTFIAGGANAAAFGADDEHATVMVGSGLLARPSRQQIQDVAGAPRRVDSRR